jgi:TolB protein
MTPMTRTGALIAAAGVALLTAVMPGPAGAQTPEERILFTDRSGRVPVLYSMTSTGAGLRREIRDANVGAISPDGMRIAFVRVVGKGQSDSRQIFVQRIGAKKSTQLTFSGFDNFSPDWSNDGNEIVWSRDNTIWVMDANGDNQDPLTRADGTSVAGNTPAWSHNGEKIAYFEQGDIFVLDRSTGLETQLTDNTVSADDDTNPQWSPSDGQIVFERRPAGTGDDQIWTMDSFGVTEQKIFEHPSGVAGDPVYSPGGSQIAFECDLNFDFDLDICTMNVLGAGEITRTTSGHNFAPDWGVMAA